MPKKKYIPTVVKKQTFINLVIIVAFIITTFFFTACSQTPAEKEFKWGMSLSVPKHYPSRIETMRLYKANTFGIADHDHFNGNMCWGCDDGGGYSGSGKASLPDSIEVQYLSLTEGQYYGGSFALPKQKMEALFAQTYTWYHDIFKKNITEPVYVDITCGVAPGGILSVFVSGSDRKSSIVTQVAQYKVPKIPDRMNQLLREGYTQDEINRKVYTKEMFLNSSTKEHRSFLDVYGIPFGQWDYYGKQYPWAQAGFCTIKNKIKWGEISIFCNYIDGGPRGYYFGEDAMVYDTSNLKSFLQKPSALYNLPSSIEIAWAYADRVGDNNFHVEMILPRNKVIKLFEDYYTQYPDKKDVKIIVEIKEDTNVIIWFMGTNTKVEITKRKGYTEKPIR